MNSYIYEFKDLPSTDTPLNAETFTAMQNKLLNSIYPIGRGFIDFTNTDYSNYLGFTWERELVGLTPVGLDTTQEEFDTIGKIGGEKTHVLTLDEIPSNIIQTASSGNNSDGFIGTARFGPGPRDALRQETGRVCASGLFPAENGQKRFCPHPPGFRPRAAYLLPPRRRKAKK